MILLRTIAGIVDHWPMRRHEWTMGFGAIAMSAALSLQQDMFDLARHYATLQTWTTEETCADIFFLCGAARIVALVVNGTFDGFSHSPHLRVASAIIGTFLWGLFSYSFLETYWSTSAATSLGPFVAYGVAAAVELTNVRSAAADLGALARGRA